MVLRTYAKDQPAYAKYKLEPTAEELQVWEISKHNPLARTVYLVMTVRNISCTKPLLKDSKFAIKSNISLRKELSTYQKTKRQTIRKMVGEIIQNFSEDTFQNINYLVRAIIEDIFKKS